MFSANMAPLFTTSLLLLAATAHAHFKLNEPASIGFSDDDEGTGPCGSFTPDFSKDTITDFHVGGQPIAMLSTHPETKWLFRATFAEKADGEWEQLYSIVDQQGIGDFCVPAVTAPKSWVGSTGVLSVVADATDGQIVVTVRERQVCRWCWRDGRELQERYEYQGQCHNGLGAGCHGHGDHYTGEQLHLGRRHYDQWFRSSCDDDIGGR